MSRRCAPKRAQIALTGRAVHTEQRSAAVVRIRGRDTRAHAWPPHTDNARSSTSSLVVLRSTGASGTRRRTRRLARRRSDSRACNHKQSLRKPSCGGDCLRVCEGARASCKDKVARARHMPPHRHRSSVDPQQSVFLVVLPRLQAVADREVCRQSFLPIAGSERADRLRLFLLHPRPHRRHPYLRPCSGTSFCSPA